MEFGFGIFVRNGDNADGEWLFVLDWLFDVVVELNDGKEKKNLHEKLAIFRLVRKHRVLYRKVSVAVDLKREAGKCHQNYKCDGQMELSTCTKNLPSKLFKGVFIQRQLLLRNKMN